jgi:diamine N-acetyltransferase
MIQGQRIRMRAPEREDIPLFLKWINDPEVSEGLIFYLPMSKDEEEHWYDAMIQRPAEEHPLTIEIREGEDWKAIGNAGFHLINWRVRAAMVGIMIGEKEYWNQGYGTEAMGLLLKLAFETLNLNRVALDVYADNPRAIRCYQKTSFVLEGTKRQAMYRDGKYVDVLIMSVLRSEWKPDL